MSDTDGTLSIIGNGCWHAIGTWGDRTCQKLCQTSICNSCPVYLEAGQNVLSRMVNGPESTGVAPAIQTRVPPTVASESIVQVIVSNNVLGIPTQYVTQVVPPKPVHPLPEARLKSGLVSIDGQIHLYVSGRSFFELDGETPESSSQRMMLVLRFRGEITVIDVDRIVEIVRVSDTDQLISPFTISSDEKRWVKNTVLVNGTNMAVVNVPALLTHIEGRI